MEVAHPSLLTYLLTLSLVEGEVAHPSLLTWSTSSHRTVVYSLQKQHKKRYIIVHAKYFSYLITLKVLPQKRKGLSSQIKDSKYLYGQYLIVPKSSPRFVDGLNVMNVTSLKLLITIAIFLIYWFLSALNWMVISIQPRHEQVSYVQPHDKTNKMMCAQHRLRSAWASGQFLLSAGCTDFIFGLIVPWLIFLLAPVKRVINSPVLTIHTHYIWASSWQNQNITVRLAKTQISLAICPVWSESSMSIRRKLGFLATHSAQAKTLIKLGGCPGWSESLLDAQSFCWFWHEAAHIHVYWAASLENLSSGVCNQVRQFGLLS